MPVALKGSTSGQVTIQAPAVAGTNTLTVPATTGNIITSADSGTVTGSMLASATVAQSNLAAGVAGNGPAFYAYISANQTGISNATNTRINHNTKVFDTATCYNNTGSTVTLNGISVPAYSFAPNVAGYYLAIVGAAITTTTNNYGVFVELFKNNTFTYAGSSGFSNSQMFPQSNSAFLVYLNGTSDYITSYVYGSVGSGTFQLDAGGTFPGCYTYFQAFLMRSA